MSTSNNINNNNENNTSNVFHNKYILNNIFHQIDISDNDTNTLKEGIIINNKIKFGDVTSLEWMVKNGQFDLLKFKFETGKQVDIDESAIRLLFNEYSLEKEFEIVDGGSFFNNYCKDRECYNSTFFQSFKDDQYRASLNNEKLNEMIPFILSKCREQLLKFDLEKVLTIPSKYFKGDFNLLNSFINNPSSIVPKVKQQVFQDIPMAATTGIEEKLTLSQPIQYRLILKSTGDVDWVIENIETIKTLHFNEHKQRDLFIFKFQSYQIIEYGKLKFQTIDSLVGYFENDKKYEPTFIHSFSNAVNNCDIESLKKLQNDVGNYKFFYFELLKSSSSRSNPTDKLIKQSIKKMDREAVHSNTAKRERKQINFNGQTTSSLNQLFEYLNSTGYQLFKPELFKLLVKSVASAANKNDDIDLSKLSIDFNKFPSETIQLLIESITNQNLPNVIQLILGNGFDSFSTSERQILFDQYWYDNSNDKRDFNFYHLNELVENSETGHSTFRIKPFNNSCLFYGMQTNSLNYTGNNDIQKDYTVHLCTYSNNFGPAISKSIKLLLNSPKFNNHIEIMINYLFKRLIKVEGITQKQIDEIYQSIKSTFPEFKLEHSLYHSFYYLTIKSLRNTKMILDYFYFQLVGFEEHRFIEFDEMDVNYEEKEQGVIYNDFRSIDKNEFTYDFVFGSSFSKVMDKLILNLLYAPFVNINVVYTPFSANNIVNKSNLSILIETPDLYYNLLLSTLENLLEFKQIDLFFKQLDIVQDQLANTSLKLGGFPTIVQGTRIFYYSKLLFTLAFKVLDSDQFDKFSNFQSFKSIDPHMFDLIDEIEKDEPLILKFKDLISKQ